MIIKTLLNIGVRSLEESGIEDAAFDARELLLAVLHKNTTELLLNGDQPVTEQQISAYETLLKRRKQREPLQYILGEWGFYGNTFFVGEGVLIPRPETERLTELAVEYLRSAQVSSDASSNASPCVWDLCAGSGCVGISVALSCPEVSVYAYEKSEEAFSYLERNIRRYPEANVTAVKTDVLLPQKPLPVKADVLLSNPPYIPSGELPGLQAEVQKEPAMALDGGADGLLFYRAIKENWFPFLKKGGLFAFECGEGQTEPLKALFSPVVSRLETETDFSGLDRIVWGIL